MTLAPGDSIVQMLTSLGGCDSLAVLRVVGVDTVFSSLDTLICLSSTILIHGVTLPPDTTAIFYLKTQMGCDSVLTVNTLALDTAVHYLTLAVCPGDSALYNGGHYPAGNDYTFHFSGGNGCDSTVFVHVLAFPGVSVNLPPIDSIALGDTIMLQPAVTGTPPYLWMWSPATGLSCTDCANPIATPQQNGIYLVKVTDANGCTAMDSIAIAVNRDCAVYIPNAFTPNSDNLNDWFTIFSFPNACIREITVLRIFDRWGELVFERRHFASNVGNLGWDGRYRGQDMPSDVLVWYAEWQLEDGSVKRKSGDVTLLR
jgi:gliding motility-associated-like protein